MLGEQLSGILALEGVAAGECEECRDPEGIEIAAPVDDFAGCLLRAHHAGRPHDIAHGGHRQLVGEPGDSEVGHQDPAAAPLEQDVLRLHVPVDDAVLVGVCERPSDLLDDLADNCRWEGPIAPHPLRERLTGDVPHDEADYLALVLDRMDGDDVRMGETGGGSSLPQEPAPQAGEPGQFRWQQLDRHLPLECQVAGEVHDTHSAAPEFMDEQIAPAEHRLEGGEELVG